MLTGISLALVFIKIQKRFELAEKSLSRSSVAQFCEIVSLKILLPSFIMQSLLREHIGKNLVAALVLGFCLPIICLTAFKIYRRITNNSVYAPKDTRSFKFLISTFGGGNRGTIFIIALFGATPNFPHYLKYFSLVDLGNFTFLLLLIPLLLKKEFKKGPRERPSLIKNYVFVALLGVLVFFLARKICLLIWGHDISIYLEKTEGLRKKLFTFLLFSAITLRTRLDRRNLHFFGDVFSFYSVRLICIALVTATIIFTWFDSKIIPLSAIILLLMPPSSILPSMVAQTTADSKSITYINTMTMAFNIIYLGLLVVVIVARMAFQSKSLL